MTDLRLPLWGNITFFGPQETEGREWNSGREGSFRYMINKKIGRTTHWFSKLTVFGTEEGGVDVGSEGTDPPLEKTTSDIGKWYGYPPRRQRDVRPGRAGCSKEGWDSGRGKGVGR